MSLSKYYKESRIPQRIKTRLHWQYTSHGGKNCSIAPAHAVL